MSLLSQAERARRSTRRINNRIAKSLPLFSGTSAIEQFLTTEQKQLERVMRWDEISERYFLKMDDDDKQTLLQAQAMRNKINKTRLPELDKKLHDLQTRWSGAFTQPHYIADFWRSNL